MSTTAARSTAAGVGGLTDRLAAAVRPEFRVDVLVPAVGDPILGTPPCIVAGCVRSSRYDRLCLAHLHRWKDAGRPEPMDVGRDGGPGDDRASAVAFVRGDRLPIRSASDIGCAIGTLDSGMPPGVPTRRGGRRR